MKNWKKVIGWGIAALVMGFVICMNILNHQNRLNGRHVILALEAKTGPAGSMAKYSHQGYHMAIEDIKKQYGDIIELLEVDTGGSSQRAITEFHKLKGDNMSLLVELSSPTKAVSSLLNGSMLTIASPVDVPNIANPQKGIFRIYISADASIPTAVKFIREKGIKNVATFTFDDESGLGFKKKFKATFQQSGGNVVSEEVFTLSQHDGIREQIYKALKTKPEAIFIAGVGPIYAQLFRLLRQQEYQGLIVTTWAMTCPEIYEQLGTIADGVIVLAPQFQKDLTKRYEDTNHTKAYYVNVAYGYDSIMLIADAYLSVQKGKSKTMAEAVKKMKDRHGFSGTFQILPNGDITNNISIYMMKNGKFFPIESAEK